MNSADQIDPLGASRFKMKSGNYNLPSSKSDGILENERPGMRKAIQKEENYNIYGDAARKVEIEASGEHGGF